MKKMNLYKLTLALSFLALNFSELSAQVGINTNMPKATLDVKGKPQDTSEMDGVLVPRLTGDELQAKTYGAAQNGAIIFATQAASSPSGQVKEVLAEGLYYFSSDMNKWVRFKSNSSTLLSGDIVSIHFLVAAGRSNGVIMDSDKVLTINDKFNVFIEKGGLTSSGYYNLHLKNVSSETFTFSSHAYPEGVTGTQFDLNQSLNAGADFQLYGNINWVSQFRSTYLTLQVDDEFYKIFVAAHQTTNSDEKDVILSMHRIY